MIENFLNNPLNEFHKLDQHDKQLFLEILENQPSNIDFWILDIGKDYARKSVMINCQNFILEAKRFQQYLISEELELKDSLEKLKDPLDTLEHRLPL